jgi:hypothetical protein
MSHDFSLGTVEVALSPLERFEEFLQARGKRITQQRRILVEQIASRVMTAAQTLGHQRATTRRSP